MKKLIIILLLCAALTACKNKIDDVSTVCIDNVEYIKFSAIYQGYLAPHYKPDGTLYLCN